MFCQWCGNKIDKCGKPCPHCGKAQERLVNGNAFWDLIDEAQLSQDNQPIETDASCNSAGSSPMTRVSGIREILGKPEQVISLAVAAVLGLLLIAGVCVTVRSVKAYLKSVETSISDAESSIHDDLVTLEGQLNTDISNAATSIRDDLAGLEDQLSTDSGASDRDGVPESSTGAAEIGGKIDFRDSDVGDIDSLEATNRITVERFNVGGSPNTYVYQATGALLETSGMVFCWERSADSGQSWQPVAESNASFIVSKDEDGVLYRVICFDKQVILDADLPKNGEMNSGDLRIDISQYPIAGSSGAFLYHAEILSTAAENISIAWQRSDDGKVWSTCSQNSDFLVSTDMQERYRLAVISEVYYFAEYFPDSSEDNSVGENDVYLQPPGVLYGFE